MSFEDATTFGIGVVTCGQSFYQNLADIPLPGEGMYDGYVLIYGGSTATGTLAIQYAKLYASLIDLCSSALYLRKGAGLDVGSLPQPPRAISISERTRGGGSLRLQQARLCKEDSRVHRGASYSRPGLHF